MKLPDARIVAKDVAGAQLNKFAGTVARLLSRLTGYYFVSALCVLSQALAQNPVPYVTQPLLPGAVAPGEAGFVLTVHGTGFVSGAIVRWNGIPLATTFISNSQLNADVPAANVAAAGTAQVTVANPRNTAASNVVFFPVVAPIATVLYNHAPGSPIFQGGTDPHVVEPSSVATADFNGDGKLDLAIATQVSGGPGSVDISLGNGDGTFSPTSSTAVDGCPCSLAVEDLNGDGKLDLVVANSLDRSITVLLGKGDGTFTFAPVAVVTVGANPTAVVIADFNGDGNLDLAVAKSADNTVSILLGNGDGTFRLVSSPTVRLSSVALAVGDFNGDGTLDLAVASSDIEALTVLLGNGDGSFTYAPAPAAPRSENIVAADFNGDGKLDLAVSNGVDSTVTILLGQGDGTFVPVNGCCGTSVGSTHTFAMVTGDLNGDGKLDLVLAIQNSKGAIPLDYLVILLGNGDGTFVPTNFSRLLHADVVSLTAGDFNDDGRPDFAAASAPEGVVSVLVQTGMSTPAPDFSLTTKNTPITIKAGDTANFALQVLSQNGFTGELSFQCSGAPQFAECANPDSVFLFDGATASLNMSVSTRPRTTTANILAMPDTNRLLPWLTPILGTLIVLLLVQAQRTRKLFAPTLVLGLVILAGCGANSTPPLPTGTPPGQYVLTVTATSGTITHSIQVTLVVQ